MLPELISGKHVAGLRQSTRAVIDGTVKVVYVAHDADKHIVDPIVQLCRKKGVHIVDTMSMKELSAALNIEVNTAVAATLS